MKASPTRKKANSAPIGHADFIQERQGAEAASSLPPPEKLVGALSSGIAIIRYLNRLRRPAGVSQVANELGLNISTCFNLLRTLVHEDLVTFDPTGKTYALGLGLVQLAKSTLDQASSVRLIRPHLEGIAVKHRVTVTLWQRSGEDRVVLIDRADTDFAVTVHMNIGQRLPLYIGALGRCMAAYGGLSVQEVENRFREVTWQDPPSFSAYWSEAKGVLTKGYATDHGNYFKGVTTVSSPVLDGQGKPVMAISAVGFTAQFTTKGLSALGTDLHARARQISRAIAGASAD